MIITDSELKKIVKSGNAAQLKALLLHPGCKPRATDSMGITALMMAATCGYDACVQLLLPLSDVAGRDENGMTVLMRAAAYGQASCLQLLLPTSDAMSQDKAGMTALMWAANRGNSDCIQLLLPVSNTWATDGDGLTAYDHAVDKGNRGAAAHIETYNLALSEAEALGTVARAIETDKSPTLRV